MKKSIFEQLGGTWSQQGDYLTIVRYNRTLALSAVFAAAVVAISLTATHLVFRKSEIK